jgi:hypothetical protein
LALTFGTLLSSQGADARRTRPWKVVVSGGLLSCSAPGPGLAVVPGAERKLRGSCGGVKPGGA